MTITLCYHQQIALPNKAAPSGRLSQLSVVPPPPQHSLKRSVTHLPAGLRSCWLSEKRKWTLFLYLIKSGKMKEQIQGIASFKKSGKDFFFFLKLRIALCVEYATKPCVKRIQLKTPIVKQTMVEFWLVWKRWKMKNFTSQKRLNLAAFTIKYNIKEKYKLSRSTYISEKLPRHQNLLDGEFIKDCLSSGRICDLK